VTYKFTDSPAEHEGTEKDAQQGLFIFRHDCQHADGSSRDGSSPVSKRPLDWLFSLILFAIALLLAVSASQAQEPPPDQLPEFYERSLASPYEALAWIDLPDWARRFPIEISKRLFESPPSIRHPVKGDRVDVYKAQLLEFEDQFRLLWEENVVKEGLLWDHCIAWPNTYWSLLFRSNVFSQFGGSRLPIFGTQNPYTQVGFFRDLIGQGKALPHHILTPSGQWIGKQEAVSILNTRWLQTLPWGKYRLFLPYNQIPAVVPKLDDPFRTVKGRSYHAEGLPYFVKHGWKPRLTFPSFSSLRGSKTYNKIFNEKRGSSFLFLVGVHDAVSASKKFEDNLIKRLTAVDPCLIIFRENFRERGSANDWESLVKRSSDCYSLEDYTDLDKNSEVPSWMAPYRKPKYPVLAGRVENGRVVALREETMSTLTHNPGSLLKHLGYENYSHGAPFGTTKVAEFKKHSKFRKGHHLAAYAIPVKGSWGDTNRKFWFYAEQGDYLFAESLNGIPELTLWNDSKNRPAEINYVPGGPLQTIIEIRDTSGDKLFCEVTQIQSLYPTYSWVDRTTSQVKKRSITTHSPSGLLVGLSKRLPDTKLLTLARKKTNAGFSAGMNEYLLGNFAKASQLWISTKPPQGLNFLTALVNAQAIASTGDTKEAYRLLIKKRGDAGETNTRELLKEWRLTEWALKNSSPDLANIHFKGLLRLLTERVRKNKSAGKSGLPPFNYNITLEELLLFSMGESLLNEGYFADSRRSLESLFKVSVQKKKWTLASRALRMLFTVYERTGNIKRAFKMIDRYLPKLLFQGNLMGTEARGIFDDLALISLRTEQPGMGRHRLLQVKAKIERELESYAEGKEEFRRKSLQESLVAIDSGVNLLSASLAGEGGESEAIARKILGLLRGESRDSESPTDVTSILEVLKEDLGDPQSTGVTSYVPPKYDHEMGQRIQLLGESLVREKEFETAHRALYFARQVFAENHGKSSLAVLACENLMLQARLEFDDPNKLIYEIPSLIQKVKNRSQSQTKLELDFQATLARAFLKSGNAKDSVKEWKSVIQSKKQFIKEAQLGLTNDLNGLAEAEIACGEFKNAVVALTESIETYSSFLQTNLFHLTDSERLNLARGEVAVQRLLNLIVSMGFEDIGPEFSLFEKHLDWKGKSLRTYFFLKQLESSSSEETHEIANELNEIRTEISHLFLGGKDHHDSHLNKRLGGLATRRKSLELSLNQSLESDGKFSKPLDPKDGLKHILSQGALVDYVVTEDQILAWVVQEGVPPKLLGLGDEETVKQAYFSFRDSMGQGRGGKAISTEQESPGEKLRELIWDPIAKLLNGTERVFLSLDGFLTLIPFDALPDGKQVLLERFTFSRLPDLTWGIPRQVERPEKVSLLALGDVKYGPRRSKNIGFKEWISLPASLSEVVTIQALFSETYSSSSSEILMQEDATEKRLRETVGGQSWIHLATHGFFEPNLGMNQSNPTTSIAMKKISRESPGLLAGIVLAGANEQQLGNPQNDGYLTAEEFCALDLKDCHLLTLSACNSSRGKSVPGEGLISMTRSAKQAGAEAILSSLWLVDDFATKNLMVNFYTNYWSESGNGAVALRNAKLAMLQDYREDGADYPEYWAAFVYHGL